VVYVNLSELFLVADSIERVRFVLLVSHENGEFEI